MKILHCSDVHLGKKPFGTREFSQKRYLDFFRAFDQICDKGIELKVDLMLIAGDLFDKKELTPDTLERCEKTFLKLKNAKIDVLLIEGNHDNISGYDEVNSWISYLERKDYVKRGKYSFTGKDYEFEKIKIGDVNFYGVGYPGFAIDEVLEKLSEKLDENEKNIVLVHTAIGGGSEFIGGLASTSSIKKLKDKAIYIAGGHLHSFSVYPKDEPILFIPGSLEFWNVLNERSNTKGGILFDTDTKEYKFIEISPRKRVEENFVYEDNLVSEFETFVKSLELTGEELVIINVKLKDSGYVNVNELESILENDGALKGYINLRYPNSIYDRNMGEDGYYSVKDVEKEIVSHWEEFSDREKVVEYLQSFKEYQELKEDMGDEFFELFDKMLEGEIGE